MGNHLYSSHSLFQQVKEAYKYVCGLFHLYPTETCIYLLTFGKVEATRDYVDKWQ